LNDCEQAYRELLNMGHQASDIAVGGDSAGGNFLLALLQRIRKAGLPMPACAVPVSPVTELSRVHGLPSRYKLSRSDALLPAHAMQRMCGEYVGAHDSTDPEISPIYMDCEGLPPLFFLASSNEILMDDTVFLAKRTSAAGIDTTCHIWPVLPHAFPLFGSLLPEAIQSRHDIGEFMRQHLAMTP
jgi:acetyl esterase/lipase